MTTSFLLNHPAHVEHVLQRNHRNYRKSPMATEKMGAVLGEGLATSESDLWARQRKLIQPSFNRQRVDALGDRMVSVIDGLLDKWRKHAMNDEEFNLTDDTSYLTLELALQTMFGTSFSEDFDAFAEAMRVVHEGTAKKIWDVTGIGDRLPTRGNRLFKEAMDYLNGIVDRVIAERRAKGTSGEDLLDILMDAQDSDTGEVMSDKQLRAEVMTMMISGHDTTTTMVAWALLILSQHKTHLECMRDEVDQVNCYDAITPTMAPVSRVVMVPEITARGTSSTISRRRSGTMVAKAPMPMPMEARLAKPHNA